MQPIEVQKERLELAGVIMSESELEAYYNSPDVLGGDLVPLGYKRCGTCKRVMKFSEFYKSSAAKNHCTGTCKSCQQKASKKSYDKCKVNYDYKKRYQKNREKHLEYSKDYYRRHKDELKKKHAAYKASTAGRKVMKRAHSKRRKALEKNSGIPYTREMIIERDSNVPGGLTCILCGEPIQDVKDIHLEHLVPIVMGGYDCITNIACAHSKCNLEKSKDAKEISTEQIEEVIRRAEKYIVEHPDKFPDFA